MATSPPNTKNVLTGKPRVTGAVFVAPVGTPLPTSTSDPLDPAFVCLGFVGEDGLVEANESSTEKITAWGGATVKVVRTESSVTHTLTLIESGRSDVLRTVYGDDNVVTVEATATEGTKHTVKVTSEQVPSKSWVYDMADAGNDIRLVCPEGQLKSLGEIEYVDAGVTGFEVEVEDLPDADGVNVYKYISLDDATG